MVFLRACGFIDAAHFGRGHTGNLLSKNVLKLKKTLYRGIKFDQAWDEFSSLGVRFTLANLLCRFFLFFIKGQKYRI